MLSNLEFTNSIREIKGYRVGLYALHSRNHYGLPYGPC